jgi:aldose 1-epimerase
MSIESAGNYRGQDVQRVTIRSRAGASAQILTWGAALADLHVPWRGTSQRVTLGLKSLDDYVKYSPHMGAIAGRFANRIGGARFELDGRTYDLPKNFVDRHCLHGGVEGQAFGKRPWTLGRVESDAVTLTLSSPDGDAGFPGNLTVTCEYRLIGPATLRIALGATSDKATPINLAPHGYFNLDGEETIAHHTLQIESDFKTLLDEDSICTGEIVSVEGSPHDFRMPGPMVSKGADGQLFPYDINFCLRSRGVLARAATARSEKNGLSMEVWTDQPGVQFYDAHKVNIPVEGIHGWKYGARAGFCLEPQVFPNSPNIAHFPNCILRPGQEWRQTTELRFSTD